MGSPPPGWRESSGGLRPTWGNAAASCRAGLSSISPHLARALQLRGLGGESWGPGASPLPISAAQGEPGGPGHLSPILFEPSAAAIKAPPLPSPTLKEPDLKLI